MKFAILAYIPAAVCAFISLLALPGATTPNATYWQPAFFAFLPLCFVLVATAMLYTQKETKRLKEELDDLKRKLKSA
jgi:hypothetical protein